MPDIKQIQWFPGHMAKTRRLMKESLPDVDIVLELLDARIPYSSKNPEIKKIIGDKPIVTILNKASLADPKVTADWCRWYRTNVNPCVTLDCLTGEGVTDLKNTVREVLADKIARYRDRGMEGRRLKAMIVGIPNVGKSSLINRLAGGKHASHSRNNGSRPISGFPCSICRGSFGRSSMKSVSGRISPRRVLSAIRSSMWKRSR